MQVLVDAFHSPRWLLDGDVSDATPVTWLLGLKAKDSRQLADAFAAVSDPAFVWITWGIASRIRRHVEYGRYLSAEAADALTAPAPETLHAVHSWLGHRRTTFSPVNNVLQVWSTVGETRVLLGADFAAFRPIHGSNATTRILRATTAMTLPTHVAAAVSFVSLNAPPLQLAPMAPEVREATAKSNYITPLKLRQMYSVPKLSVQEATQSVPAFFSQSWSPADLAHFERLHRLQPAPVVQAGDRNNNASAASGEISLDLQYITAMAPNATTTVWSMNGSNPFSAADEPFLEWATQVLEMSSPPLVHSISYADDEDHVMAVAKDYAFHLDTLLQKMAVRGLTVLVASGDDGVAGTRIHSQKMSVDEGCAKSGPQWPSSSPYVTTVGATQLGVDGSELVCSGALHGGVTSGGGFSNVYEVPAWQKAVVGRYLASAACPTKPGFFNPVGRGYPDVAVIGAHYSVVLRGKTKGISGTSASTPAFAGLVTLWNDQRLAAGLPPLGFLNPLLYKIGASHPHAFHDIVAGDNGAARNGSYACPVAFHAGPGWDATTGFGSPRFDALTPLIVGKSSLLDDVPSPKTTGLSSLEVAAIVTVVIGLLGVVVFWYRRRRSPKRAYVRIEMPAACTN
ncbi:tripeptidyl-peptidase [Achlya hypogyna]|uniref:subtilisin n=1 Tax=Achlya hypogyna TaxID=1202772 RepID=A0A1V9Z6Z3_ACHHY|nr:tripeptidyl-peptidase [Achlya hypogyna]